MQTVKTIKIKNSLVYIDDEDFAQASVYRWRISPDGYVHGYHMEIRDKDVRLHRLVMSAPKGLEVDHIDGNKLNNTKTNLRLCNRNQNKANTRIISTNTSGFKGVSAHKGRWQASIRANNRLIYLGRHDTKQEAAHVYNTVAEQIFGDFAWLNPLDQLGA